MEKYFEKLIENYEKVLIEEIGEGKLKKRLLNKLEGILSEKTSQDDLLDKPINYSSILKNVKNKGFLTRVTNALKILDFSENIKTYKDLQRECYNYFMDKGGSWKNEKTYVSYLNSFRNMGRKSAYIVTSHLNQINFDFSKESAKKVFEKNKK